MDGREARAQVRRSSYTALRTGVGASAGGWVCAGFAAIRTFANLAGGAVRLCEGRSSETFSTPKGGI